MDSWKQKVERCLPGLGVGNVDFGSVKGRNSSPLHKTVAIVNNTGVYNEEFVKRTDLKLCALVTIKQTHRKRSVLFLMDHMFC